MDAVCSFILGLGAGKGRTCDASGRGVIRVLADDGRRAGDVRSARRLNHKTARRDQARELGITELLEQPPYVPVDRLLPHTFPLLKVATDKAASIRVSAAAL